MLHIGAVSPQSRLLKWLQQEKPDALVVSTNTLLAGSQPRAWCQRHGVRLATLYWTAQEANLTGVDQCYDRIAAHAVDLVVAQLNSNEIGQPDLPRMMLFPGRWQASAVPA